MGPRGCKARGSASEAKARGKRAKRGTPRAEQLCFDQVGFRAAKRRGKRRLGRPRSESAGVSHLRREGIAKLTPVHVTVKAVEGLPSLRGRVEHAAIVRKVREARERAGRLKDGRFRIVQYSVQPDHVHLVVEADSPEALARGAAGLSIRIAKALNELWKRSGTLWRDRYHAHVLRTPTEVYRALRYVFTNAHKHGCYVPPGAPDPCSSGRFFDGWKDCARAVVDPLVRPVVDAATWLLRVGWSRAGELWLRPRGAPC